jgi:hypothetical protein
MEGLKREFLGPSHSPCERIVREESEAPSLSLFPPVRLFSLDFRTG